MPSRRDPAALRAELRRLKREVAELRAAEASYRTIVDRTNSIVLRWDPEGRILFLNDFGLRLFGYTLDEVVDHSVLGLIVPDTETSGRDLVAMINDLLQHPERYVSNENENMRHDGERVWITRRNTPITDPEGRLIEIVSTGIDSTDRKRADDRLRASEERFRELAVRDNLTGLYNTRHLYQALETLITSSATDGATFSVLFIDLDHFKRVVDARGHLNGSRAIQEVAATIRDTLELVQQKYGATVPLDDLFKWSEGGSDWAKALTSAHYIGKARIAGQVANHYAFRQPGRDWQIWIADSDKPTPLRMIITASDDPARPKFQADLSWDTSPQFAQGAFVFAPPPNAKAIQ